MKLNERFEIGDVVEVQSVTGSDPLPWGVGPGLQVRVVRLEGGFGTVEREGREWRITTANLRPRRPSCR